MFFLKLKYEVFKIFKAFKSFVEKFRTNKIKVFKNDNGKIYVNNNIQHLCEYNGIQMQHSVPYTPQQNGVAECKNRALKEMATSTLDAKYLSHNIWV